MTSSRASSSSSSRHSRYQVFLSFRGADTRKSFTDHLYAALTLSGIRTFRDDDAIDRGEDIESEIHSAIHDSTVSVIVFSKYYASSRWCLDELALILERRRADGHAVLPIFYDIDPDQVWEQSGSFAESFDGHRKLFETDRVERWRANLREVVHLGGMVLRDRYETQFIRDIVKEVEKIVDYKPLHVSSYLVGIDSYIEQINLWLQDGSSGNSIAVIHGLGGVGKTTIAKTVYNGNCHTFEGRSFLANVREASEQSNGMVCLQRQLLSDIIKRKNCEVRSADEGTAKIRDAIRWRRVLIVLDDVDHPSQFNAIIGRKDWLYEGSKVIVTTRNERLLKGHEACKRFVVSPLNENEALQLFSWHAFGQTNPTEGYAKYSKCAVHHCCGLPLALEVLGSSLFGQPMEFWKTALKEPQSVDEYGKIQKVLKISYDSLPDDRDKTLFLDVACFFCDKDKEYVDRTVEGCDFYRNIGIQTLLDRHLVHVDRDRKLRMHQLLRDMGREIVRQASPEDPGKRSRLWHRKDVLTVLKRNTGTETVRSLILDQRQDGKTPFNDLVLKTKALEKMSNLKLLHLNNVKFEGDYEFFSKSLVWLCWGGFPLDRIPNSLFSEDMIVLDVNNSSLIHTWMGTPFLPELKILDLSHSDCLVSTSDLSGLLNLQQLILKGCINLCEVHESIGDLDKLVFLNLENCSSLRKLPKKFCSLKSLEELILSGCSELDVPMEIRKMESLKVLHADGIAKNQLEPTKERKMLSFWTWFTNFSLNALPCSLVDLSVRHCNISTDDLPKDFSCLARLQYLDLSGNPIHTLPESITGLNKLKFLGLFGCRSLQSLPMLPRSLVRVNVGGCTILKELTNLPSFFQSLNLDTLYHDELFKMQYTLMLRPLGNSGNAMVNEMDLLNLETPGKFEVAMFKIMTSTSRHTSLQILLECRRFSLFLSQSEVSRLKLLDFAQLQQSCRSFFGFEKPKSACSCWLRGRLRAAETDCEAVIETRWQKQLNFAENKHSYEKFLDIANQFASSSRWSKARAAAAKGCHNSEEEEEALRSALFSKYSRKEVEEVEEAFVILPRKFRSALFSKYSRVKVANRDDVFDLFKKEEFTPSVHSKLSFPPPIGRSLAEDFKLTEEYLYDDDEGNEGTFPEFLSVLAEKDVDFERLKHEVLYHSELKARAASYYLATKKPFPLSSSEN